ncbi:hypothetical protein C461_14925 [Halorubrum aidingense JCM 13560]|uniref:Conditioned medium-induced protein 4 n=1 Tax=Halorubrum aidingense JCM 13560 TaxID=1230454 RepID=M0P8K0_9EURY|nr:hypothetical protein [Halorubrum aidingense]EMA65145.1 hypothetical protein C461_14925 [Halorubrum aidingense JCM 13560]
MDEKTSELRDIFVETTGSDTVTERQAESRGTLTDRDEAAVDERLRELVAAMRERGAFSTDLDDATYVRIARGRFELDDDAAIAESIVADEDRASGGDGTPDDIDAATVRDARFDLHLVREADREVPADAGFAYAALKRLTAEGRSIVECAEALDADIDTVAKYARVARVDLTSTRANDRFRDEFRDLLTDADIEGSHAADAREDGLKDATEDLETDVFL